jgi:hypothetical protein
MRVYGPSGEPRLAKLSSAKKTPAILEIRTMSRRNIAYAVLLVASVVITACSQPTAPRRDDTTCRAGVAGSSGFKCD